MTTIITGNFQVLDRAQRAISELAGAGFAADQTTTFFVNPPGQHDLYPIGGDEDESPGTGKAAGGSAQGAAVGGAVGVAVGLATAPVLGPAAVIAATGAGAYVGALYGALEKMDDHNDPQGAPREPRDGELSRKSGMLVAVSAPLPVQQDAAIRILRAHSATDIERTEGSIVAGEWTDFNALTPLRLAPL